MLKTAFRVIRPHKKKKKSWVWYKTASSCKGGLASSLPLLPGPLWSGVIAHVRVSSMDQIDLFENYYYETITVKTALIVTWIHKNTWNQRIVAKLFVLDWHTWNY